MYHTNIASSAWNFFFNQMDHFLDDISQVEFSMKVVGGPSQKMVAADAAIRLGATWVILDRSVINRLGEFEIVLLRAVLIQPCFTSAPFILHNK